MTSEVLLQSRLQGDELNVTATGSWTATHAAALEPLVDRVGQESQDHRLSVDMQGVSEIDTFGACLLERLIHSRKAGGKDVSVTGLSDSFRGLLAEVDQVDHEAPAPPPSTNTPIATVESIGRATIELGHHVTSFMVMLGALAKRCFIS